MTDPTHYTLSTRTLNLMASVYHRLGEVKARHLLRSPHDLEKAYRISAVHATLAIEGNLLAPLPMARLVDRRGTAGTSPEALEVINTQRLYDLLPDLHPFIANDLRHAHAELMHGLSLDAGSYREGPMDVLYGDPRPLRTAPADNLAVQVEELLHHLENDDAPLLIGSCVLHFGLVHLRPFGSGNGRIARAWQRRMLMEHWPVFSFLPVEAFIHATMPAYHAALEYADRQGDCGAFITYMLERIDDALAELLSQPDPALHAGDRMTIFLQQAPLRPFGRKDYLAFYPELSTASASRDLRDAVAMGKLTKQGHGRNTVYGAVREG